MRDMKRTDWTRILEREYSERAAVENGRRRRESLMLIKKVAEPLSVSSAGETAVIADDGYNWLQIAVEGCRVWLTAMFDGSGDFLQIYFDITAGNSFEDPENPKFEDMYLDVVVTKDYRTVVLDEDELDEALSEGIVTQKAYDLAKEDCAELCRRLRGREKRAAEYCIKIMEELRKGICTE